MHRQRITYTDRTNARNRSLSIFLLLNFFLSHNRECHLFSVKKKMIFGLLQFFLCSRVRLDHERET